MTDTARRAGAIRAAEHRAADPLTSEQIDAIVLDAAVAGCTSDEIRQRLDEARQAVRDGLDLDERGRVKWAY